VIAAWGQLAPDGDHHRRGALEALGRELIATGGIELSGGACGYVLSFTRRFPLEDEMTRATARAWKALKDDAPIVEKRLLSALKAVLALHGRAMRHKWYQHPDLAPPVLWDRARDTYALAGNVLLNIDPLFPFLRSLNAKAKEGAPNKRRNKELRVALSREFSLNKATISQVLSGLGYTKDPGVARPSMRPVTRADFL
jgi:hypothetical protein